MGENNFSKWTVAIFGIILLLAAITYFILIRGPISIHGGDSVIATAVGRDLNRS